MKVEWFALIFLSSMHSNFTGYLGYRSFILPVEKIMEEQGLYFCMVLLIKAHSGIFQCDRIKKIISQRFRK